MVAGELAKRSNVKFVLMVAEQDPANTPSCSPAVSKSYACPIYTNIRGYGLLFFLGSNRACMPCFTRAKHDGARLSRALFLREIRRACFGVAKLVRVHPRAESKRICSTRPIPGKYRFFDVFARDDHRFLGRHGGDPAINSRSGPYVDRQSHAHAMGAT